MSKEGGKKKVIPVVFALAMLPGLLGAAFAGSGIFTICDDDSVMRAFEDSNYAEGAYVKLRKELRSEVRSHGLPDSVALDPLNKEDFTSALKKNVAANLEGRTSDNDAALAYASELGAGIESYIEEKGAESKGRIKNTADEICTTAQEYYRAYSTLPFAENYAGKFTPVKIFFYVTGVICLTLALLMATALLSCSKSSMKYRLACISAGFLAAGAAACLLGRAASGMINSNAVGSLACYRVFIDDFFGEMTSGVYITGIAFLILGMAGLILAYRKKS